MSIPYYTKHLSTSPVVDYNGLSLLSPYSELSPVAFAQYGFVPGFLDNYDRLRYYTGLSFLL